ncbi:MAG: hypothetical protein V1834_00015 [Candidatus Micrarchaeota archaeon]
MRHAQMSIEILGMVAILLIVLVIFSAVSLKQQDYAFTERARMDGNSVCQLVAYHINSAASIGDGYSAVMVLPNNIAGSQDYYVQVLDSERRVRVEWYGAFCELPVLAENFSGTVSKGESLIKNEGGTIVFS